MIQLVIHITKHVSVARAYSVSTGKWWGCNWPTLFGPMQVQLENVRARQARLVADATSGKESEAWSAVAKYLSLVEDDAASAEKLALEAVNQLSNGRWSEALASADAAVALESKYRSSKTWRPLRDAIVAELSQEFGPNLAVSVNLNPLHAPD